MISKRWLLAVVAALLLHGVVLALWSSWPAQDNQLPPGDGIGLDEGGSAGDSIAAVPALEQSSEPSPAADQAVPAELPSRARKQGGRGGGNSYLGQVRAHLNAYRTGLPSDLTRGVVQVRFVVDRQGQVSLLELARGSGSAALDQQALALVARASPLPVPPEGRALRLVVPVEFSPE